MNPPVERAPSNIPPDAAGIGVSLTDERGERYRYRAGAVNLRIERGVAQIVGNESGCFMWFDRCDLEIRDGRRRVVFRLLGGSASRDSDGVTIVAEFASPRSACPRSRRTRAPQPSAAGASITTVRRTPHDKDAA